MLAPLLSSVSDVSDVPAYSSAAATKAASSTLLVALEALVVEPAGLASAGAISDSKKRLKESLILVINDWLTLKITTSIYPSNEDQSALIPHLCLSESQKENKRKRNFWFSDFVSLGGMKWNILYD